MAAKKTKEKSQIDVGEHVLLPKHTRLSDKDRKALFEKYGITAADLPKIVKDDPAIRKLDLQPGDVVRIDRASPTAKRTTFYRGVADA